MKLVHVLGTTLFAVAAAGPTDTDGFNYNKNVNKWIEKEGMPRDATIPTIVTRDGLCDRLGWVPSSCPGVNECVPSNFYGDGHCDDEFDCEEMNYDNGDCVASAPPSNYDEPDCNGDNFPENLMSWISDGYCDNGVFGPDFNCAAYGWDGGDCKAKNNILHNDVGNSKVHPLQGTHTTSPITMDDVSANYMDHIVCGRGKKTFNGKHKEYMVFVSEKDYTTFNKKYGRTYMGIDKNGMRDFPAATWLECPSGCKHSSDFATAPGSPSRPWEKSGKKYMHGQPRQYQWEGVGHSTGNPSRFDHVFCPDAKIIKKPASHNLR